LVASQARPAARNGGHQISKGTLAAAEWMILITSLKPEDFPTADVLALYRLRWRIEPAFKRLKSLVGLKRPPGSDERSARPYVLAHLLMILWLEPLVDAFEDSPRSAAAASLSPPPGASCASWSQHFAKPSSPSRQSPASSAARQRGNDISPSHRDDKAIKN
jgi:hypothetical protein